MQKPELLQVGKSAAGETLQVKPPVDITMNIYIGQVEANESVTPKSGSKSDPKSDPKSGPIQADKPGSSAAKPITVGSLRVNPPTDVTMKLYIRPLVPGTQAPPPGPAPNYTVTSGDVYVLNGSDTVDINFGADGGDIVEGTVNVIVQPGLTT